MLAAYAASRGIGIAVADYGGVRTEQETNQILQFRIDDYNAAIANGTLDPSVSLDQFRPIAEYGKSYHNYGAAFDVRVVSRPSTMSVASALATLGAYAPSIGLRWGGTFSNPDTPHFELAQSLSDVADQYRNLYGYDGDSNDNSDGITLEGTYTPIEAPSLGLLLVGAIVAVVAYVMYRNRS